jgi:hypothetical protein
MTTFGRDAIIPETGQLMDIYSKLTFLFPDENITRENMLEALDRLLTDLKDLRALNTGKITELSTAMRLARLVAELGERRDDLILMSSELSDVIAQMDDAAKRAGITITDDVEQSLAAISS